MNHRARAFFVLVLLALAGSCVSTDSPTGVGDASGPAGVRFQPSVIPSAANATALPIDRIRTIAVRDADEVVLADSMFDVDPADTTWTLTFPVPLIVSPTVARVYVYLINAGTSGPSAVQFSGVTDPLELRGDETTTAGDFPLVRGPLDNLSVTAVTIDTSAPSVSEGQTTTLSATVTTSDPSASPVTFWTSLDTMVVRMAGSLATGVAVGTADVVASAGPHADTVTVTVVPAVDSVLVSPDSADVSVGATVTYTAETFDSGGNALTGRTVTWSTADASVATVSPTTGVVTGVAAGTTTVTATSEGVSDGAKVVVLPTGGPSGGRNTWIATGGLWSTPANWSLGRVPIATDTVFLTQGDDYAVTLDTDVTVASLTIGGTIEFITLYVNDFDLIVANSGTLGVQALGGVEIGNGTITAGIIDNAGSVRVSGQAAMTVPEVTNTGTWTVASGAQATLTYSGGANFIMYGTLSLESGAELVLQMGNFTYYAGTITGPGQVVLQQYTALVLWADLSFDGPTVRLEGTSVVSPGVRRHITVGPTSNFYVGSVPGGSGTGVGAVVTSNGTTVAYGPFTTFADSLYVGASGGLVVGSVADSKVLTYEVDNAGTITMSGAVDATFGPGGESGAQILNRPGAVIEILGGGGSRVLNGQLDNQGTLLVGAPTVLHNWNASGAPVAASHVNTGLITLSGDLTLELGGTSPTFTNSGTVTVGGNTTLTVQNLSDGYVYTDAAGVLNGTGTVDVTQGTMAVAGANDGTIAPGSSPGVLSWIGDVPMGPSGSLAIEINGTTPGTGYDQLSVNGSLILDANGTLDVSLSGFTPTGGDRYAVMTYTGRSGTFGAVNLPSVGGFTFDTVWAEAGTTDTLYIEASASVPASINSWVSAGDGTWSDPANWSKGAVPTASDSVLIQLDAVYTVFVDQAATAQSITLGASVPNQTLLVQGVPITVSAGIDVGLLGTLQITDGGSLNGSGTLVNRGSVQVSGTVDNDLAVDNLSTLQVQDGALFTQNASVTNSLVISVTADVSPTLMIVFGGLTNTSTGIIALEDLSTNGNRPDLRVDGGTLVNEADGVIYTTGPGFDGASLGAALDNKGSIQAGASRPLDIDPPAPVVHDNSGTIIGYSRITFTNVDAFINSGSGSIDASQGIDVSLTGAGAGFTNSGTLTTGLASTIVNGDVTNLGVGLLTVASGTLTLGGPSNVTQSDGDIFVDTGATLELYGNATLSAGGTIGGNGTVDTSNTTAGSLDGDVLPGGAGQAGTLSWIDDYVPSSTSSVVIEIGGTAPGTWDILNISQQTDATGTFAGALVIDTIGGFAPKVGNFFPVITFDNRTNPFESVTFPNLGTVKLDTMWTDNGAALPDTLYIFAY